ncbi:DUF4250 domain-containing protein [Thaumasiovibrio subtropicus]|uniref:DUF4250 domain-containing protein n=1 Tax=Thaumasiovibrio subtropicus TaxID=1891207 RepID=UPI000B3645EA|nr:DUF4250 domain-containing protein [Thaumasiovibrio subtropicus]
MEVHNLLQLDSRIALGIINERLRLDCDSMEELVLRYELDVEALISKMGDLGYHYDPITNQFK